MLCFIWEHLPHVTDSWHEAAGITCIASDLQEAKRMICEYAKRDWIEVCDGLGPRSQPTLVFSADTPGIQPQLFVFPDAGCC